MQTCIVAASGVALSGAIQTNTIAFSFYIGLVLDTKKCENYKYNDQNEIIGLSCILKPSKIRREALPFTWGFARAMRPPSPRRDSFTVRCLLSIVILGSLFAFIVMNFNLTTGYVPSLNAGAGFKQRPFKRQENTVTQTCIVAASGVALSGLLPMARFTYSEGPIRQRNVGNSFHFHCHEFQSNNQICAFAQCWSRFVGFFFTKTWMKVSAKLGFTECSFTRHENTVMQTCIVAASGVTLSGTIQTNTIAFTFYMGLVLDTKKCENYKYNEQNEIIGDEATSPWRDSLTERGLFTNVILGTLFAFIVMNFNLTTGYVPSLNVGAVSARLDFKQHPFTRQENTVMEKYIVAALGVTLIMRLTE
ncbi:metal-nicotianamine transporter YSL1-like protein [Cinnamomum micranthum f. kanehirae]|uniref:Metal-nicotianamine transporter YSL1-like protein n=1 Tax=Cinnamomum micranthum f. kanehirae TaxID=337451 RepID=A0A443NJI8_9MAGN|nr:metal-nicotianamine transporter YSL1-like protein [Cinnamomum micranthum f. kanehirae]